MDTEVFMEAALNIAELFEDPQERELALAELIQEMSEIGENDPKKKIIQPSPFRKN